MNGELTAIDALKEIKDFVVNGHSLALTTEEKGFPLIEKSLKALEIIRIVCPNIFWVMRTSTYKEYKKKCSDDTLLQEEYELLKEVF